MFTGFSELIGKHFLSHIIGEVFGPGILDFFTTFWAHAGAVVLP